MLKVLNTINYMANLQFYKGNTAPTDAEKGSIWFDEKEKKIKVKDTDGWVSYADSNTIEHIFVGNREYPAKSVEGVRLDPIEKGVQLPESPYLVTQDNAPEIYNFFNTFLTNAAQASAAGKTTASYSLTSSEQSTIFEKIVKIPKCFTLDPTYNIGVFFWSMTASSIYINCLPGHYVMGNKSYNLSALTAAIGGRIVDINIYKNFTPTTSGDGTKYLNDKGEYDSNILIVNPNDDFTALNKTNAEIYAAFKTGKDVALNLGALGLFNLEVCDENTAYFRIFTLYDDGDGHIKYYIKYLIYSGTLSLNDIVDLDYVTSSSLSAALFSRALVIELTDAKINAFQNFKVGDSITTENIDVLFQNTPNIQLCYNTGSYQDGTWYLKKFTSGNNQIYGCYRIFQGGHFYCELTCGGNSITAINRGTEYFDRNFYVELIASGSDNPTWSLNKTYEEIRKKYTAGYNIVIQMISGTSKTNFLFLGNFDEDGFYYFWTPIRVEDDYIFYLFVLKPDNTVALDPWQTFSGDYNDLTNKPDLTLSWAGWN